jgi:hypothetical protein
MVFRILNSTQNFQETIRQERKTKTLACLNPIKIHQALGHLAKEMVLIRMAMGIMGIQKLDRVKTLVREGVAWVRIKMGITTGTITILIIILLMVIQIKQIKTMSHLKILLKLSRASKNQPKNKRKRDNLSLMIIMINHRLKINMHQ